MFNPWLLHTCNSVLKKGPRCGFWTLLRFPGDGLGSTAALDTGMQRQDNAYVASCL